MSMRIDCLSCNFGIRVPSHMLVISTVIKSRPNLCAEKFLYIHAKCVGSVGSVASKRKDYCFIWIFIKKVNQHHPILNQHFPGWTNIGNVLNTRLRIQQVIIVTGSAGATLWPSPSRLPFCSKLVNNHQLCSRRCGDHTNCRSARCWMDKRKCRDKML